MKCPKWPIKVTMCDVVRWLECKLKPPKIAIFEISMTGAMNLALQPYGNYIII